MPARVEPGIDWGFVRARRSLEGRQEYLSFLERMRPYWPEAQPLNGEDPALDQDVLHGVRLMGQKEDPATDTYVTTRVFVWSVVPLLALAAYRVHETSRGGMLFIAREPLPEWGKALNIVTAAVVAAVTALLVGRLK